MYVDGQRAENKMAAAGLLCVDIGKGTHTIELKYVPKGFVIGIPLNVTAFIILLVMLRRRKRIAT